MKNTISWKITRWLILIVLPFNFAAFAISVISIDHAASQTRQAMQNLANLAFQQLDARISASNTFFYNIDEDRADFKLFARQGERSNELILAETSLAKYFDRCTDNNLYVDCIFWQSDNYNSFFVSIEDLESYDRQTATDIKTCLYHMFTAEDEPSYAAWTYIDVNGSEWLIKTYKKNGLTYGGLFSLDEIRKTIYDNSTYDDLVISFYPENPEVNESEDAFSVTVHSQYTDMVMRLEVPQSSVFYSLSVAELICVIMLFAFIMAIPLLLTMLNKIVVSPLRDIEDAMQRIKCGEADYRLPPKRQADEFMLIAHTFNEMNDTLRDLKIENYERELDKQKMELRNLQLQIRPHFLMNMFNLLFSFAQIKNYQSIQKLAIYLSDYFRHIFQSNKDTQPFEKEFLLIQKYLEISEMRYPDWYEVVFNVDAEALEVEVPPLLIHNFIENIFKHVIDFGKVVHIRLEAYTTDCEAIFMIVDDGCGMPQEVVDDINNGIFKKSADDRIHVGVQNSHRRLKSIYGDKAQLLVDSIVGKGTCFTIVIPLEDDDEFADS